MNTTESLPVPTAAPPVAVSSPFPWLRVGIVLLAAVLRLWDLELRPPHFDEGVNGWFTDQMQHLGCYEYDPHNYHGPLHFYVLFFFVKTLFGRHLWALRLPVVLVSILTVDWMFRFGRFLGRRTCAWAALAMTLSPGFLYYQRDAIHETWLVYFLILGFWGFFGLWQDGGKKYLWAVGLGLTGAILTKETYLIHLGCLALAIPCVLVVEALYPSARSLFTRAASRAEPPPEDHTAPPPLFDEVPPWSSPMWRSFAPQAWRDRDAWAVAGVSVALIIFFYSGNFYHWEGVKGLVTAFEFWGKKSQDGEGHNKPFLYWTRLLLRHESWAYFGMLASFFYALPPLPRTQRWVRWAGAFLAAASLDAFTYLTEHYSDLEGTTAFHGWLTLTEKVYMVLWTLCVGLFALGVAALNAPAPRDWRLRLLAIYGLGNLVAYSLIPYKTPWCVISFAWPFLFVGGAAISDLADLEIRSAAQAGFWRRDAVWRTVAPGVGAVLLAISAFQAVRLNYFRPTDDKDKDKEDYVYVQTFPDMWKITDPLLHLAHQDPTAYGLIGNILCGSTYPLPWMLGDFTRIGYYSDEAAPSDYRADFLLVVDSRVVEAESHLDDDYFKETVHLRSAQAPLELYLRASRFAGEFPGRKPEFHAQKALPAAPAPPVTAPAVTTPAPETTVNLMQ